MPAAQRGNGIRSAYRPTRKPLMSPWRQFAYLDAWIPGLSLAASALLSSEREMERKSVLILPIYSVICCLGSIVIQSQSIMQRKGNKRKTNTGETKRERVRMKDINVCVEGPKKGNHATCTSLIWLLALRTMAGNKCMEIVPPSACVCPLPGVSPNPPLRRRGITGSGQ